MTRQAKHQGYNVIAVPTKGPPYVYIRMQRVLTAHKIAEEFLGPNAYILPYTDTPAHILNQARPFTRSMRGTPSLEVAQVRC
jgi:hypothetical protein